MMLSQAHFIFPADMVGPPGPLPAGAKRVELETLDGHRLHGVHIPASGPAGPRTLVLGFGGNAWNGEDVGAYLHGIFPEADVVTFHYRGYRPSTGRPSAAALLADAPLIHDFAVERVKPRRTVVVGFSIGSGVAASLAKRRPVDGLILVTPFDSLKAVAAGLYPWLPVGLFFQHEIDAADSLAGSPVPVAVIAAEHDEIIAGERTAALRDRLANLRFDHVLRGAGHNDIYQRADFQAKMREAMAALR